MLSRSMPARRVCVAVLLALMTTLLGVVGSGSASATGDQSLSVLTRNLYLGTDLTPLAAAETPEELIAAATAAWANVAATDFPVRAEVLATEIQLTRPDVIGLQEVILYREQLDSDFLTNPLVPNAKTKVYDFLALLQDALARRGLPYVVVSKSRNADVEVPRLNPTPQNPARLTDVRLTDHDVILVRASLKDGFSNPMNAHYGPDAQFRAGPFEFTRGWASIDYEIAPHRTVRIFNTHLETSAAPHIQLAQAEKFVELASGRDEVIALGDFNSGPGSTFTDTYELLSASFTDAWAVARPHTPGYTCCQPELLDTAVWPTERIDLVLTKGSWNPDFVIRTGQIPFRFHPPIWASDHFGVFAHLTLS